MITDPGAKVALIRSIVGHDLPPEQVVEEIQAILDGATLEELARRRVAQLSPTASTTRGGDAA